MSDEQPRKKRGRPCKIKPEAAVLNRVTATVSADIVESVLKTYRVTGYIKCPPDNRESTPPDIDRTLDEASPSTALKRVMNELDLKVCHYPRIDDVTPATPRRRKQEEEVCE